MPSFNITRESLDKKSVSAVQNLIIKSYYVIISGGIIDLCRFYRGASLVNSWNFCRVSYFRSGPLEVAGTIFVSRRYPFLPRRVGVDYVPHGISQSYKPVLMCVEFASIKMTDETSTPPKTDSAKYTKGGVRCYG